MATFELFRKSKIIYLPNVNESKLRIHWRLSAILKTSEKSVWSNVFLICKSIYILKLYSVDIEMKHKFKKKSPWDKISGTKNTLVHLSRALTHHSSTFNLRFLYELKHKILISKTVGEIFHFQFRFVFIKVYIFVHQNPWTFWL